MSYDTDTALTRLRDGNNRFTRGEPQAGTPLTSASNPLADSSRGPSS